MDVGHAAQDRMGVSPAQRQDAGALLVVRPVVPDPGLAEDPTPEAALPAGPGVVPAEMGVRALLDREGVGGGPDPDDRASALEIVGEMPHLVFREVLEPQSEDQQIGGLQRLEAGDVRAARLDEAALVEREEDVGCEAVSMCQDARQRGQDLLRAVLVVARDEDDLSAHGGSVAALVGDPVGRG